jgi:hypothetical protein
MHTRANRIHSTSSRAVSAIPEVASAMPQAVRGEKRKKAPQSDNRKQKRTKQNHRIRTAPAVEDSTVRIQSTALRRAPVDDASRQLVVEGSTIRVGSPSIRGTAASDEARQQALPDPNQPIPSSPAPSIVSVGIRSMTNLSRIRSPHASSSVSQQIASSPLRLEAFPTPQTTSESSQLTSSKRYSSRSVLAPRDLRVTAVLETTCRMMEKHLLTDHPFPTEPELILVR